MVNQQNVQCKGFSGSLLRASSHFTTQLVNVALIATIVLLLIASPTVKAQVQLPPVPADSSAGVTRATSANKGMICATGYVLSGSSCVLLAALVPVPSCAYGKTWSGSACVDIAGFFPAPKTCPSGQYLSGGLCVAVPVVCPTGQVLSGGVCKLWANGGGSPCSSQPVYTQYLPCPSSQGSITQNNSGTVCDASTAYNWAMSGWVTTANTCH